LLPIPLSPRRTLRASRQERAAPVSAARAARAWEGNARRMMEAVGKRSRPGWPASDPFALPRRAPHR